METQHWTEHRHPYYERMLPRWERTWTHYEADLAKLRTKEFLLQRVQGEGREQFEERLANADYLPLFGTTVDKIVGKMGASEKAEFRTFDEDAPIGNPEDEATPAGRIWYDVDGDGTNYTTAASDSAVLLTSLQEHWVLADGVRRVQAANGEMVAVGDATARIIKPQAVVNWREDARGNLVEVLVRHEADVRASIRDKPQAETRYTLYALDGHQLFRVVEEDGKKTVVEEPVQPYGDGFFFYRTRDRRPENRRLPIFRVRLPLRRMVGHLLAEKNGAIFNRESERDNLLRIANTPKASIVAGEDQWSRMLKAIKDGENVWFSDPAATRDHSYLSPPTGPAEIATAVLTDKIKNYMLVAFQSYEQSVRGREKTATEVRHDAAMGEGSFLSVLAAALDEMENQLWWLWEQIHFPNEPEAWGHFKCERPREFAPLDETSEATTIKEWFWPLEAPPLGPTAERSAATKFAKLTGLDYEPKEIESAIGAKATRRAQERASVEALIEEPGGDGT